MSRDVYDDDGHEDINDLRSVKIYCMLPNNGNNNYTVMNNEMPVLCHSWGVHSCYVKRKHFNFDADRNVTTIIS